MTVVTFFERKNKKNTSFLKKALLQVKNVYINCAHNILWVTQKFQNEDSIKTNTYK